MNAREFWDTPPRNPVDGLCLRDGVAVYLTELSRDSVVSTSHVTLRALYNSHGEDAVQGEIDRQFQSNK